MKSVAVIENNLISLKQLAQLTDQYNWQRIYDAIRRRAARGKYSTYQKIKGEGYISIYDPLIPDKVKLHLTNTEPVKELDYSISAGTQNELNPEQTEKALAWVDLLNLYIKFQDMHAGKRTDAKKKFETLFNNGAFPELSKRISKKVSWKTIETHLRDYRASGNDYRSQAPGYKRDKRTCVPPEQAEILIKFALDPNQPLISEVVRKAMDLFLMKNHNVILSKQTYSRFITRWSKEHFADWVFFRKGEKALNDEVLPYLERDYDRIEVGDIIVADGHVLNFDIINPFTGKPKRMTMVLFFDMKSNFPLGWEIAPTENVLAIAVAFRRAVLMLGKIPRIVYLDNGRAFGAKYFNGVDFNECGITGLFERLGVKVITAIPYHAQSKTVERLFRTFAEIERMLPTYTGTSIQHQPPRQHRGERIHNDIHAKMTHGTSLNILQAHQAVAWWFDKYAQRIQQGGHLKGTAPIEIFNTGKGPGIDKAKLIYLMMTEEVKTIYRNGINMFGASFWNEALFGRKEEVIVKYDLIENDSIFVYDRNGNFICEAARVKKVHPAAEILGNEEDVKLLQDQLKTKAELKNSIVAPAKQFLQSEIYPTLQKQLSDYNIIRINENPKLEKKQPKKKRRLIDSWETPDVDNKKRKSAEA